MMQLPAHVWSFMVLFVRYIHTYINELMCFYFYIYSCRLVFFAYQYYIWWLSHYPVKVQLVWADSRWWFDPRRSTISTFHHPQRVALNRQEGFVFMILDHHPMICCTESNATSEKLDRKNVGLSIIDDLSVMTVKCMVLLVILNSWLGPYLVIACFSHQLQDKISTSWI